MDLWARIKGKDYPIATGASFTDEFSETLDSGTIIIPHVKEIIDLKPYDDVFIHDYGAGNLPDRPYGTVFDPYTEKVENGHVTLGTKKHFYRHMLAWTINREQVSISDTDRFDEQDVNGKKYKSYIFNYTISLISETKGLEAVQLPNKTISQPMRTTKNGSEFAKMAPMETWGRSLPFGVAASPSSGLNIPGTNVYISANTRSLDDTDVCSFTQVKANVKRNDSFRLPDFMISGITCLYYKPGFLGISAWDETKYLAEFHPVKHWIVSKAKMEREDAITAFENLIHGKRTSIDVLFHTSSSAVFSDVAYDFTEDGTYYIYLYCEPIRWSSEESPVERNLIGMTDNSDGVKAPDADSQFIARWTVSVTEKGKVSPSVMTAYEAVREAIDLYSPWMKVTYDGITWSYMKKYVPGDSLNKLRNVIAPEMTENFPSLRTYLTHIFRVVDAIPIVHDGVIGILDLSKRSSMPFYNENNEKYLNRENWTMDGSQYSDRLVREYSGALSKSNITKSVERIGFRNTNSPILTLENLQLELSHPIYDIQKVYMCYYKRSAEADENGLYSYFRGWLPEH